MNTVHTVADVGSNDIHMLDKRDSNPPIPSGSKQPYTGNGTFGGIDLPAGSTLWPNFPGFSDNLVCFSGCSNANVSTNSNSALGPVGARLIACPATAGTAGCTLGTQNGAAIINPATGKQS